MRRVKVKMIISASERSSWLRGCRSVGGGCVAAGRSEKVRVKAPE